VLLFLSGLICGCLFLVRDEPVGLPLAALTV
jgi:hypothetical protein